MNTNFNHQYNNLINEIIDLAALLNRIPEFEEILRIISEKSIQIFRCDYVHISVLNPQTQNTVKTVIRDQKNIDLKNLHFININISGWILKKRKHFISDDITADERFTKGLLKDCGTKSALGTILYTNDQPIGVIILLSNSIDRHFSHEDTLLLEKLSSVISPFINRLDKIHQYFVCDIPESDLINKYNKLGLIGKSIRFVELLKSIESASKCDVRVLLEGETGTGKELVARAIHKLSSRSGKPFIVVDCAAIQDNLIESELFGHTKGAFTGAIKDRSGIIQEADGGTLFIDEVNHLPQDMQIKFLRFLQQKEFRPVGSNQIKKSDVRIITASSVPLNTLVKEKMMREELMFRLNVYPIRIPSLNDRIDDIMLLAHHFIKIYAAQQNKLAETTDNELMNYLIHRNWAGNVRELENFIERMVTLVPSENKIIEKNSLPEEHLTELFADQSKSLIPDSNVSLTEALEEMEIQMIRQALVINNWNQSRAASSLSIPEQTLRYKMHKYKITKPI